MTTEQVVTLIVGLIVLGVGGFFIYRHLKNNPNASKELKKFLDEIQVMVKDRIITLMKDIDFTDKNSIAEAEEEFLRGLYDDIWEFVSAKLDEYYKDNALYDIISSLLTKDKIEEYVTAIFDEDEVQEKIISIYNTAIQKKYANLVEEDEKLEAEQETLATDTKETGEVKDLDPLTVDGTPIEEAEANLNPPKDEEDEVVDPTDESIEVIEILPTVDITVDINKDIPDEE